MIQLDVYLAILKVQNVRVFVRVQLVELPGLRAYVVAFTRHLLLLFNRSSEHLHDLVSYGVPLIYARNRLRLVGATFTLLRLRVLSQLLESGLLLWVGELLRYLIMPTVGPRAPLDGH